MLGVFNIQEDLWTELDKTRKMVTLEHFPDVSGLFIDWVTKDHIEFPKQAAIIEHYVKKGVPIIIYDRFFSLEKKEFNWLKKFDISFFEPAINNRPGFEYIPQWTDGKFSYNWEKRIDDENRKYDLAYTGKMTDRIAAFEQYYLNYAGLFPNKKVVYSSELNDTKINYYCDYNLYRVAGINSEQVSFTILIGSPIEYRIGYLRDDLFDIMKAGIMPLLPFEHRFFGTVFKNFLIDGENDLDYYICHYSKIRGVLLEELYEKLLDYYPEFKINFIVDKINNYV